MNALIRHNHALARERVPERRIRDRSNPLEYMTAKETKNEFRFYPETLIWMVQFFGFLEAKNNRGKPLPPLLQLLTTLFFLGSGTFYRVVGRSEDLKMPKSSVCRSIWKSIKLINKKLDEIVHISNR